MWSSFTKDLTIHIVFLATTIIVLGNRQLILILIQWFCTLS